MAASEVFTIRRGLIAIRNALAVAAAEGPSLAGRNVREGDDGVRLEVRRHGRRATLAQIAGRGHDDLPDRADARGDRGAFRQRADAQRSVESFLHQVDRPVEQRERHGHIGETLEKLDHDRDHVQSAEHDRRGDAQFAARCAPLPGGRAFDLVEFRQHPARARQEARAGIGQADRPGGAIEQPDAKAGLQFGDGARDRGRRAAEVTRRRGEAAPLGHLDEQRCAVDPVHLFHIIAIITC